MPTAWPEYSRPPLRQSGANQAASQLEEAPSPSSRRSLPLKWYCLSRTIDKAVSVGKGEVVTKTSVEQVDYTIRESQRAKRVILKVSRRNGLEVVVPTGFDTRQLPRILKANRTWIETQLAKEQRASKMAAPNHIDLKAIGEHWQVQYQQDFDARFSLQEVGKDLLLVRGETSDAYGVARTLHGWLHLKAHVHLVPWLRDISREVGIPFKKATVRGQATRWASCSKLQNISLNRSLLFLPMHLVRHIFLHELCHIKQLDHSLRFWELVQQLEPDYKCIEAEVRKANRYLAEWITL